MSTIKITSDLHFFHDNIIKHCDRPCEAENHNEWLIEKLNSSIGKDDTVYHLGDFAYGKYKYPELKKIMSSLNGNWLFILGNHDKESQLKELCKGTNHRVLGDYHTMRYNDKSIIMFHYPIENWWNKYRGSFHFHGHTHNNSPRKIENRYNVCLDHEMKVYDIDEFFVE